MFKKNIFAIGSIINFILCIILCIALTGFSCYSMILMLLERKDEKIPETRVMCGNYYDYQVVKTVDGNIWQINREYKENQLLQLMFDTKGTETVIDDEIINIKEVIK